MLAILERAGDEMSSAHDGGSSVEVSALDEQIGRGKFAYQSGMSNLIAQLVWIASRGWELSQVAIHRMLNRFEQSFRKPEIRVIAARLPCDGISC